MCSGPIRSKSNDVVRFSGIPELAVSFLMREKSSIHVHSTHWNKNYCDFGPVTVISCETALFFIYIWIISVIHGMQQTDC